MLKKQETPVVEILANGAEIPSAKKTHAEDAFEIISRMDFAKAEQLLLDDEVVHTDESVDTTGDPTTSSSIEDNVTDDSSTTQAQWDKMRLCLGAAMMEVDTLADVRL